MNIFFIIIIGFILFEYILSFIVRTLNLKALDPKLPEEFSDVYDKDKYLKSQEYAKTNSKFSYITSTFSLILGLAFIFSGFYNVLDLCARSLGFGEAVTGLFFFGLLFIINDILSLPFSIYRTFVIEERYGFNKTTYVTFFTDKLKQYFLMLLIGAPLIYLIILFFDSFNEYAWLLVWGFITLFMIVMQLSRTQMI